MPLAALLPYLPHLIGAASAGIGALTNRGQPAQTTQLQNFNPQQQAAFSNALTQGQQNFNPQAIANQARTNFQQNTIPSIAERFTSLGGGQNSSAFSGSLGAASSNLEQALAALQSNMGLQQLQLGLTPQFENVYQQRQPGFAESAANPTLQALLLYILGGQGNGGLSSLFGNAGKDQFNYSGSRFANPSYSAPQFGNPALQNLSRGI